MQIHTELPEGHESNEHLSEMTPCTSGNELLAYLIVHPPEDSQAMIVAQIESHIWDPLLVVLQEVDESSRPVRERILSTIVDHFPSLLHRQDTPFFQILASTDISDEVRKNFLTKHRRSPSVTANTPVQLPEELHPSQQERVHEQPMLLYGVDGPEYEALYSTKDSKALHQYHLNTAHRFIVSHVEGVIDSITDSEEASQRIRSTLLRIAKKQMEKEFPQEDLSTVADEQLLLYCMSLVRMQGEVATPELDALVQEEGVSLEEWRLWKRALRTLSRDGHNALAHAELSQWIQVAPEEYYRILRPYVGHQQVDVVSFRTILANEQLNLTGYATFTGTEEFLFTPLSQKGESGVLSIFEALLKPSSEKNDQQLKKEELNEPSHEDSLLNLLQNAKHTIQRQNTHPIPINTAGGPLRISGNVFHIRDDNGDGAQEVYALLGKREVVVDPPTIPTFHRAIVATVTEDLRERYTIPNRKDPFMGLEEDVCRMFGIDLLHPTTILPQHRYAAFMDGMELFFRSQLHEHTNNKHPFLRLGIVDSEHRFQSDRAKMFQKLFLEHLNDIRESWTVETLESLVRVWEQEGRYVYYSQQELQERGNTL